MDPQFSETQYVFGLIHELKNGAWPGIQQIGEPYFPTRYDEGELGFDVSAAIKAGDIQLCPLFLQFKVADELTRGYANEWDYYGRNYYRFTIYTDTGESQHNTLVDLAKSQPFRYYAAPGIRKIGEFVDARQKDELNQRSIFVPCADLPKYNDSSTHRLTFTVSPSNYHTHSERPHGGDGIGSLEELMNRIAETGDFLEFINLRETLAAEVNELFPESLLARHDYESLFDIAEPLEFVYQVRKIFFDLLGIHTRFLGKSNENLIIKYRAKNDTSTLTEYLENKP